MNRNTYDGSDVDTPFSQASFDFRPGGNELGDRSYVVYDLDNSPSTPFTPASFVFQSGKDLDNRPHINPQLDSHSPEAPLLDKNFNPRVGRTAVNKRNSSSAAIEYSSSFAFQNYKNKHRYQGRNPNLDVNSRLRPQDIRVRNYSSSDDSYGERRDAGMISANDRQNRISHINRPTSITFDGGIYSTAADAKSAMINPPGAGNAQIRPKSTQARPRSKSEQRNQIYLDYSKPKQKKSYKEFIHHFPYFGFVACFLCSLGGTLFSIETNVLQENIVMGYQQVCHTPYKYPYIGNLLIICKSLGGLVVALSVLIFFSGLAIKIANFKDGKHSSRRIPTVFVLLLYPAFPIWTLLLGINAGSYAITSIMNGICYANETQPLWHGSTPFSTPDWIHSKETYECDVISSDHGDNEECTDCINLYQFHFLFPRTARKEDMWICGTEIELLCSTYLPTITTAWQTCSIAAVIVILGIAMHLTYLSYERTELGEQYKHSAEKEQLYINKHIRNSLDPNNFLLNDKKK